MSRPGFGFLALSVEGVAWGPFCLDLAAKATLLLAAAFAASAALRRRSAAIRLLVWNCALIGLLLLPLLTTVLPGWSVPLPTRLFERATTTQLAATPGSRSAAPSAPPGAGEPNGPVWGDGGPAESRIGVPRATAVPSPADPLDFAPASRGDGDWNGSRIVAAVWLLGSGCVWVAFFVRWALVRRIVRRAAGMEDPAWGTLAKAIVARLGLRRAVRLAVSSQTPVPMTCGLLRPVVVLPESVAAGADADQRRAILVHELVHVERYDVLAPWLAAVCGGLYWWNPLVWLAARERLLECEKSCDDRVLAGGARPSQYAAMLIEIARAAKHPAWRFSPASTIGRPSLLHRRVAAIVGQDIPRSGPGRYAFAVVAAAALVVGVVAAFSTSLRAGPVAGEEAIAMATAEEKPVESAVPPNDQAAETPGAAVDLYGDPLPAGAVARLGTVRFHVAGRAVVLAFTADGTKLFTAASNGELRLWDVASGKPLHTWRLDDRPIRAASVAAHASIAASLHIDENDPKAVCSLAVWDLSQEKPLFVAPLADNRNGAVAVSPDGSVVAVGPYDYPTFWLSMWSIAKRERIAQQQFPLLGRVHFKFTPDGESLLAHAGKVYLWCWKAGRAPQRVPHSVQWLASLHVSPDGKTLLLASGIGATQSLRLPDCQPVSNHPLLRRGSFDGSSAPAISPDGKLLALGGGIPDPRIGIWETATRRQLYRLEAYSYRADLGLAAYSPDSKRFAVVESTGAIRIWDLATGKPIGDEREGHRTAVKTTAFLGKGSLVATAAFDRTIRIWDARTGRQERRIDFAAPDANGAARDIRALAASPDGKRIAAAGMDSTVRIWDAETGRLVLRLPGGGRSTPRRTTPYTGALAFSVDGQQVASCGDDEVARRWNAHTGEALGQWPLRGAVDLRTPRDPFAPDAYAPRPKDARAAELMVDVACFSGEGRRLATAASTMCVFDVASGKQVAKFETPYRQVQGGAISPDGTMLLTEGVDRQMPPQWRPGDPGPEPPSHLPVRLWELPSGKTVWEHRLPRRCLPGPVAFSPDGKFFASTARGDAREIRLWNAATRQPVLSIQGLPASPTALAFSADNTLLAAGLEDGSALVWRCPP